MSKTLLAAALLLSLIGAPVRAQQADQPPPSTPPSPPAADPVHRVVRLQHVNANEAVKLIGGLGVRVAQSRELSIVTLAGPKSDVDRVEAALREIDAPSSARTGLTASSTRSIVLTVHFLGIGAGQDRPIPSGLEDVVVELKRHFPYDSYQLLETFSVRETTNSESAISGILPGDANPSTRYSFGVHVRGLRTEGEQQLVRLSDLSVYLRVPVPKGNGFNYEDIGIKTNVMAPAGKFVVVGKAGNAGATEGFFVVLKADVVD